MFIIIRFSTYEISWKSIVFLVFYYYYLLFFSTDFYPFPSTNLFEIHSESSKLPDLTSPILLKKIGAPEGGHFRIFRVFLTLTARAD